MYEFEYARASSVNDALSKYQSASDPSYIAGGHTLLPTMKQRLASPSHLIDISKLEDLKGIKIEDDELFIGAATTHEEVADSELILASLPGLSDLAEGIGDPQVRARGTIGGSLANNDPAADYPAALIALDGTIQTNNREIPSNDFFVGLFETALEDGELITFVKFKIPNKSKYVKFPNPASRYAIVGVMFAEFNENKRVAVTGAGPCAFRANNIETAIAEGKEIPTLSYENFNSDIHASAEYRSHLIGVMTKRAIKLAY